MYITGVKKTDHAPKREIDMKTIAIIPARYASSRFTGKPLAPISGKPMIQRVYERAKRAENIADVAVATDDRRIFETVASFGGKAVMTSENNRSGTDRVSEAAEKMGLAPNDVIINLQGDQPLIEPQSLNEVAAPFFDDPNIRMATLVYRITDEREINNPKDVKAVFDKNGFALYFSRSPIPFGRDTGRFDTYKHIGIYAYTRDFLEAFRNLPQGTLENIEKLEQLRALEHGYQIKVAITAHDSPEVDLPEDIERIEKILNS